MNVVVIGTGHVGLPTAASLARLGHFVVATDSDRGKVAQLARGDLPFFEPGLADLVCDGLASGNLRFNSDVGRFVQNCQVAFICVGTPPRVDGGANLAAVEDAAALVAFHAREDIVVVEKSTVPAGTASRLETALRRHNARVRFTVVSNPEFLREGRAVEDSLRPTRILVGSDHADGFTVMRRLYRPLLDLGVPLIETDVRTAEIAKHACNAFLATKISFVNAVARVCERAGADVRGVTATMGADPRIGPSFLEAGLGYGGYCFPKDLAAFRRLAGRLGYDFRLLQEVALINDEAVEHVASTVEDLLWNLEDKRIALLGLAFKQGTDDVRLSPALELARLLLGGGACVVGFDPRAGANAKMEIPELNVVSDPYVALEGAHCAVVCTDWKEFRHLDLRRIHAAMAFPIVVDGRNLLDGESIVAAGFTYVPIGRSASRAEVTAG